MLEIFITADEKVTADTFYFWKILTKRNMLEISVRIKYKSFQFPFSPTLHLWLYAIIFIIISLSTPTDSFTLLTIFQICQIQKAKL